LKKVLIFYISVNSGHHMAAKSIENALLRLDENIEVLTVNALNYISPLLEKFIIKTYMGVVKNTPELWEYLYDNHEVKQKLSKFRDLAHRLNSSRLIKLLTDFQPDVAVCTQAYPCGVLASYKALNPQCCPIVGVITDYVAHSYWLMNEVDVFAVPTKQTQDSLVQKGVSRDKVKVLGIPVDPMFSKKLNKDLLKSWYGIPENRKVIMVMGGGQGLIPIREIVLSLEEVRRPIHVIAVAGRNHALKAKLDEIQAKCRVPLTVYGYVNEIDQLMEIADILISKPGGLTTSEALVKKLPMIIFKPLPGQESKNTEFLVQNRIALKADAVDEIPKMVQRLVDDPERLKEICQNIELVRKPHASTDIAKTVLDLSSVSSSCI
jgi:processive 1,2-diacylglycerol beta-glucosyltransferase